MKRDGLVRILFIVAGLYDGILGSGFLCAPEVLCAKIGVVPPNHYGYVQFPAALLLVFALLFFAVAHRPRENRNLIPYGILLKLSYCSVVFGYWMTEGIPWIWKPFAVVDAAFALLFLWARASLREEPT